MNLLNYLKKCVNSDSSNAIGVAIIKITKASRTRVDGVVYNDNAGRYPFTCTDNELFSGETMEYQINKVVQEEASKKNWSEFQKNWDTWETVRMERMARLFKEGFNILAQHGELALIEYIDNSKFSILPEDF